MPTEGTGVGEAPASGPSVRGLGQGGLPLKKKVWPKANPKRLTAQGKWKQSFGKFASKMGGKRGS